MEKEIRAILDTEKKAESILDDAERRAVEIRTLADKEINTRTRIAKEQIASKSAKIIEDAYSKSELEHLDVVKRIETEDLYNTIPSVHREELINLLVDEILSTLYQMEVC